MNQKHNEKMKEIHIYKGNSNNRYENSLSINMNYKNISRISMKERDKNTKCVIKIDIFHTNSWKNHMKKLSIYL